MCICVYGFWIVKNWFSTQNVVYFSYRIIKSIDTKLLLHFHYHTIYLDHCTPLIFAIATEEWLWFFPLVTVAIMLEKITYDLEHTYLHAYREIHICYTYMNIYIWKSSNEKNKIIFTVESSERNTVNLSFVHTSLQTRTLKIVSYRTTADDRCEDVE